MAGKLADEWTRESLLEVLNDDTRCDLFVRLLNYSKATGRSNFVRVEHEERERGQECAEAQEKKARKRSKRSEEQTPVDGSEK